MTEHTGTKDRFTTVGWGFWLLWVLACTVGWGVGGPAGVAVGSTGDIIVAGYVAVVVGATLAGVLQWLVLRARVVRVGWWVAASFAAAVVVGVVVFAVGLLDADVGWVLGAGLFGTVVGLLHWLGLRKHVARAGWWVLASTVGWVMGGPVGSLVGWAALGAIYGAVTGGLLLWLLRQPLTAQSPSVSA